MRDRRETWTTDEFGSSHEGAVGVLLADGTVPSPVYFDIGSGSEGQSVSEWSIYDGTLRAPRATAVRAVCSCGWTGSAYPLDWDEIGDRDLEDAASGTADQCTRDWDAHTVQVAESALPVPESVTTLLEQLREEIEKLGKSSPLAAVRAVRRLEIVAMDVGYRAAHDARADATDEQAASALGLNERAARTLLARLGGWHPYL
ncbi:hypothetical protein ACFXAZ_09755 [Streptomyces sp. NPDC059477]|uniref:hypothetical protein n=1 Tax=Streptomyces sp. NPDC059477 TaxID=3346847 RepID=UPI0036754AD6